MSELGFPCRRSSLQFVTTAKSKEDLLGTVSSKYKAELPSEAKAALRRGAPKMELGVLLPAWRGCLSQRLQGDSSSCRKNRLSSQGPFSLGMFRGPPRAALLWGFPARNSGWPPGISGRLTEPVVRLPEPAQNQLRPNLKNLEKHKYLGWRLEMNWMPLDLIEIRIGPGRLPGFLSRLPGIVGRMPEISNSLLDAG